MDTLAPNSLRTQWLEAAKALGIEARGPEHVLDAAGKSYEFAVLIPQFGPTRGMLLHPEYDAEAFAAATNAGYGVSILDPEPVASLNSSLPSVMECLVDWGWSGSESPPSWYAEHEEKTRGNVV